MRKEMNDVQKIVQNKQFCIDDYKKNRKERSELESESLRRYEINKKVLENLGVAEIFNEVIDKGILKYKDVPFVGDVPTYRHGFPNGTVIDGHEYKKIPYTPAFIYYGYEFRSISLCFNYWSLQSSRGETVKDDWESIRVDVIPGIPGGAVSLSVNSYDETKYPHISLPLNNENVRSIIRNEIANKVYCGFGLRK